MIALSEHIASVEKITISYENITGSEMIAHPERFTSFENITSSKMIALPEKLKDYNVCKL